MHIVVYLIQGDAWDLQILVQPHRARRLQFNKRLDTVSYTYYDKCVIP